MVELLSFITCLGGFSGAVSTMKSYFLSFKDFATPSLTEENTVFYTEDNAELERKEIEQFQLRRRWESR